LYGGNQRSIHVDLGLETGASRGISESDLSPPFLIEGDFELGRLTGEQSSEGQFNLLHTGLGWMSSSLVPVVHQPELGDFSCH
jgi:hypothetical protein